MSYIVFAHGQPVSPQMQQMASKLLEIPGVESVDVRINGENVKIKILEAHTRATDPLTIAQTITRTIPKSGSFKTVGDLAMTYKGETVYWSWMVKEGPKPRVLEGDLR